MPGLRGSQPEPCRKVHQNTQPYPANTPQPRSCPSQSPSLPPQLPSCLPQPLSLPPQLLSLPPQPLSLPPQPLSLPPQPLSLPQKLLSLPQKQQFLVLTFHFLMKTARLPGLAARRGRGPSPGAAPAAPRPGPPVAALIPLFQPSALPQPLRAYFSFTNT